MRSAWVAVPLILIILVAAVTGPILSAGWRDMQLGGQAVAEGQYTEAAHFYELAARLLPWRGDLWEPAGLAAFYGRDGDDAIRLLELAQERQPLSVRGAVALGSALWAKGESSAAIATWRDGLKTHPGDPELLDRLIAAYDQQGDYADELVALVNRVAAGSEPAANYRLGLLLMLTDANRAEIEIRAAASQDPQYESVATTLSAALRLAATESDSAGRMIAIGRGLGLVGEWGLATRAFEYSIESDPNNAEAWAWLGEAKQHIGQDGLHALDTALRLGPQDVLVHSLRAMYWKRQGDFPDALAEQLQAAQIQPQNVQLQLALGEAYAAAGDLVSALGIYQQATTLAPGDSATWRQLAAFCADNGVQVEAVGLPAALKAASLAPHDGRTLDVLGWSYAQAGLPLAAKQALLQAIQAEPNLAVAHLHLAETYLRIGDYASALDHLRKAMELDPNGPVGQFAAQLVKQYFP